MDISSGKTCGSYSLARSPRGAVHRVSGVPDLEYSTLSSTNDKVANWVTEWLGYPRRPSLMRRISSSVEVAPISSSYLGSVGMLAKFGADSIAATVAGCLVP